MDGGVVGKSQPTFSNPKQYFYMHTRCLLSCALAVAQLSSFVSLIHSQQLLNIDFGVGTNSAKVGLAAVGRSTNDYWNLYSRDDGSGGYRYSGSVTDLKWSDGSASPEIGRAHV